MDLETINPVDTYRARVKEWDDIAQVWLRKADAYLRAGWRDSAACCYRDAAHALDRAKENADLAGDRQN